MKANLEALNRFSGKLHISLSEPPVHAAPNLLNEIALPTAKLKDLSLEIYMWSEDDTRPATDEELSAIAIDAKRITLSSEECDVRVSFEAPNGSSFTVQDLLHAIEQSERRFRVASSYGGGINVHHVYFEGLGLQEDGAYETYWGS